MTAFTTVMSGALAFEALPSAFPRFSRRKPAAEVAAAVGWRGTPTSTA